MKKLKTAISFFMMIAALILTEKLLVFSVYIFAAVIHEMGHILAAKLLNLKIKGIAFDYSGLRIEIDGVMSYADEIILASLGPIANILFALIGLFCLNCYSISAESLFSSVNEFITYGGWSIIGVCGFFILASFIQAAINLLPIKTFDGGRILYSLIAIKAQEGIAQRILRITSGVLAFLVWTVSLYVLIRLSRGLGIYLFAISIFAIALKDEITEK